MSGVINSLKDWTSNHPLIFPFLAFIIPFLVRLLPEVLMGQFVVGFDPMGYYIPFLMQVKTGSINGWVILSDAPFFTFLLMGVTSLGVPIVYALKFLDILTFGLLGISIYLFARKALLWSIGKSLLVALVASLYFVSLRISFDLIRTELALVFLFLATTLLRKITNLKNGLMLSLSMLLVAFSEQYVAVIMFIIVLGAIIGFRLGNKKYLSLRLILITIPAVSLFFLILYAGLATSQISISVSIIGNGIGEPLAPSAPFAFSSYSSLVLSSFGFLVFCYLPLVPLILLAYRFKVSSELKAWIIGLFIALLLGLVPFVFFNALTYRWILLLVYPLAFVAVESADKIRLDRRKLILGLAVGLVLSILSIGFITAPSNSPFPYYKNYSGYFPTSMLQNTLPLQDCQDTVNCLQWINANMSSSAHLLVHTAFDGWALLYLNRSQIVPYGYGNPEVTASNLAGNDSTTPLYLIWWVNGTGWYGQPTVSSVFSEIHESGRIAVYIYAGNSS